MKISVLYIVWLFALLISCGQSKVNIGEAHEFYEAVNAELDKNTPVQQKFIDKLLVAIVAVNKENKKVDIEELTTLYEQSKASCTSETKSIKALKEVDRGIGLKQAMIDYLKSLNEAFDNEFPKTIQMFGSDEPDKFEKAKRMLVPRLKLIKENQIELNIALSNFESKYEKLIKTLPLLTGSNFEMRKLKDFEFTASKITDGTKIELLSFSGTKDFNENEIYYAQFIGVDLSSGDTVRILELTLLNAPSIDQLPRYGTYYSGGGTIEKNRIGNNEYVIFNKNQSDIEKGDYKTVFGFIEFE